jgi:hypothetical protein
MQQFKAIMLIVSAICVNPASAQERASADDQLKALVDFAIAASFHDEVIRALQEQCPRYKAQVPFNDAVVNDAKKLSPEVGRLMDRIVQGAKPLAKAHATQVIANAEGCDTDSFKKSIDSVESHQALLSLRAMQGRFK